MSKYRYEKTDLPSHFVNQLAKLLSKSMYKRKVYNTVDFPREFEDNVIVLMMVSKLIDVYIVLYSTSRLNTNYLLIIKIYYFVVKFRTFY